MLNREIEPPGQSLAKRRTENIFRWEPQPLAAPEVDPDLTQLTTLERSAEVLRYSALRFEYWLSPNGFFREWLRLNFLVAAIVAITGLLIAPVITSLLGQIAIWVALVLQIVTGLVSIAVAGICGFILLRVIKAMRRQR